MGLSLSASIGCRLRCKVNEETKIVIYHYIVIHPYKYKYPQLFGNFVGVVSEIDGIGKVSGWGEYNNSGEDETSFQRCNCENQADLN